MDSLWQKHLLLQGSHLAQFPTSGWSSPWVRAPRKSRFVSQMHWSQGESKPDLHRKEACAFLSWLQRVGMETWQMVGTRLLCRALSKRGRWGSNSSASLDTSLLQEVNKTTYLFPVWALETVGKMYQNFQNLCYGSVSYKIVGRIEGCSCC